ncbi:exodeoxyribonuclease V subunit gamma [Pseudoflavonifractor phocaeensis]|uniref:PD-(D/E)XK nuclease family protein n=1 Tax=Pseudoflavonifractor phocaeensis TaxID=1870988 RepID=UPI00195BC412|nr:PD-(D/E)XK nuclease family protein [Pseudoflavonifractor phocaeensis]MBM6870985.1 exodeoxyribonuclease V subunit gamma [Pseudoflavonifractor phocaeensis]MBM6937853.1 exodeoxyribonuclease V subunit gamma [Pseudoflavonifractor phocaeensis]
MLELLLGRSGTGKTEEVFRRIAGTPERPQILIVPEQHSHNAERQLCERGGNRVCRWAEVLSFSRLASRVFSSCGGGAAATLDAGGRVLLMYRALKGVSDQLTVYRRPSRKPSFLTGLISTVDELKSCRITPEQLWDAGTETGGGEGDKLRDISLLYGAYQALTARQGADPRDKLTRLAQALREHKWAAGKDIYLDCFTDFTPQEREVLSVLLGQAHSVTAALTCDSLERGEEHFDTARRTARQLLRLASDRRVPVKVTPWTGRAGGRTAALDRVEQSLFSGRGGASQDWAGLCLFQAASPYSEVEWTASEILRLVREEGFRFRDITVTSRTMETYGPLVETVFRRYGVPVFLGRMSDVLQKPVLALITAALDTVAGEYRYEDVFRYLKTGLTDLSDEERDLLENYVLKWKIRGSQWTGKKGWTMHPEGYGLPWSEENKALVERLNGLRVKVTTPLEGLRHPEEETGKGRAMALYRFLEEIGLPRRLEEREEALRARGQEGLAEEYRQLWDILCTALEQCAQTLGDAPMEGEEFARLFTLVLSQYDVGSIPVSLDRVNAGEMPRMAHQHCKALFLLGADDDHIPQASPSPGLLTDDDRSLLASFGLEVAPGLGDKLGREMTTVYETLSLPRERCTVSWPAAGPDGGERRPAFLVGRLRSLFPTLPVVREDSLDGAFRLSAPRPALEQAGQYPAAARALAALPDWAALVERMERASRLERGKLSRAAVAALYGRRVPMSASRMDKYRSCHFSYFMEYGLRARPRESAGFHAPEYGTFVHYVLEHVLGALTEKGARPVPAQGEDLTALRELTRQAVERYVKEELGGLEGESARFRYLFRRLLRAVYAVVENAVEELNRSDFQPVAFELGFGRGKDLPPVELEVDGVTVSVSGFVDRVDGWADKGRLYLRVVDYKTGRKSFDLTDVWNGLGLQMLLYLFTLKEAGKERFGAETIVPAGVLYFPARDAVVAGSRAMGERERRRAMDQALKRSGLILDEPEVLTAMEHPGPEGIRFLPVRVSSKTGTISGDALVSAERFGRLEKHIAGILHSIGQELAAGNINADPYWRGAEKNACLYCRYAAACQFEEGRGTDRRRYLPTVRGEAFWQGLDRKKEE